MCDHLNNIYEDIEKWWNSTNVQNSLKNFRKFHAFRNENLSYDLIKYINQIHKI